MGNGVRNWGNFPIQVHNKPHKPGFSLKLIVYFSGDILLTKVKRENFTQCSGFSKKIIKKD